MVSFLSSWLKPTGDTGKSATWSSVFLQATRQLDVWLLYMSRGGPETNAYGSVHCGSLLVKKDEHLWQDERSEQGHQVIPSNRHCMARPWQLSWTRPALRSWISPEKTLGSTLSWTLPPCRRGAASLGPFLPLRSAAKCRSWRKLWRPTATWRTWIWKGAGLKSKASRWGAWCRDPVSGVEARGVYIRLDKYDGFFRLFWSTAPTLLPLHVVSSIQAQIWSLKTISKTCSFEDQ